MKIKLVFQAKVIQGRHPSPKQVVLEHLGDPVIVLREIHMVLVPGGIFVSSVPAYQ